MQMSSQILMPVVSDQTSLGNPMLISIVELIVAMKIETDMFLVLISILCDTYINDQHSTIPRDEFNVP